MPLPEPTQLRLALDQNFPTDLLTALADWIPRDVRLEHLSKIDTRLSDLDDDQLAIALRQLGFDGLVTNNYKMLEVPHEIAALIATDLIVVATVAMGHDPIRAAGALLLELPGLHDRVRGDARVFRLNFDRRQPTAAWEHLAAAASKLGVTTQELWETHRPSDIDTPVLDDE